MLRGSMLRAIDGWHPALRGIVERVDVDSIFVIPFGYLDPARPWTPSRVTATSAAVLSNACASGHRRPPVLPLAQTACHRRTAATVAAARASTIAA